MSRLLRSAALAPLALALLLVPTGEVHAQPARLGDFSFGGGPALVVDRGQAGPAAVAEFNLLVDWFALGVNLRGAAIDGEFRPGASALFTIFGILGTGAGIQDGGPSVDFLLELPLPVYRWFPGYFTVAYRPSILVDGGSIHQLAFQMKWSTLLRPEVD